MKSGLRPAFLFCGFCWFASGGNKEENKKAVGCIEACPAQKIKERRKVKQSAIPAKSGKAIGS
jgi:hypothetical protein